MKVSIIGTGYVGLVTGACLAEKGHQIVCVDKDLGKVNKINQGISPIFEEGLEEILKKNTSNSIQATTDLPRAIRDSEITLIAVGTPFDGKQIDLTQVKEVSAQIGSALIAESRLPRGRRQKHGRTRHDGWSGPAHPGRSLRQKSGRRIRSGHESRVPDRGTSRCRFHESRPHRSGRQR